MKTKFESMQQIWAKHKDLLRAADGTLSIDWKSELPHNDEVYGLLVRRSEKLVKPEEPIELTKSSLEEMINILTPKVEKAWDYNMKAPPTMELVEPDSYLTTINHYQALENAELGYGRLRESPPTSYLATLNKTFVLPNEFIMRRPRKELTKSDIVGSGSLGSSKFDDVVVHWDKTHMEQVLVHGLNMALFREARGEWGKDFMKLLKAVDPHSLDDIQGISNACNQIAQERVCAENKELGFYVVTDAIGVVWADRRRRASYVGVNEISRRMSLLRASMIDGLEFMSENEMEVYFDANHPNNLKKKSTFNSETTFTA